METDKLQQGAQLRPNPGSATSRIAAIVLSIGVVAVMFAALSYKVFELDRV